MDNTNLVLNNNCVSDGKQYVNQNWFQQHLPFNNKKLFESNLNFTQIMANNNNNNNTPEDEDTTNQRKKSSSRDPLSHRIIEKRRRDRMNNCLADLSRLIPTSYLKKGRGRIEKTEIIEMAIKHMKHLQSHKYCTDDTKCELSKNCNLDDEERIRQYRLGYQECLSEAIRFLVEIEGLFTGDGLCRRMMDYLHNHMTTLQKVNPVVKNGDMSSQQILDGISKVRSPSLSESTTSANEKMDLDSDLFETKPLTPKPVVTSHLREMLENNSSVAKRSKSSPHISLTSSPVPNNYQQSTDQNVYNFKKEIKDRFQADQKDDGPPIKSISPLNVTIDDERISNSSLSSLNTQASDHRSETSGYSSNSSSKSLSTQQSASMFVPIFALHPSGNYYLPLTLDAALIGPLISSKETDLNSYPILHPINITVNFSYQMPQMSVPLDYSRPPPQVWPPMSIVHSGLNLATHQMENNNTTNDKIHQNPNPFADNIKYDKFWLSSSPKFSLLQNKLK
ncbi:uncharacterized protein LOC128960857 isoform X2 [Oppia nitens]|uniref:uncharacterized protein LOC128960857 isoform X2 n=1 Tax=Oppia nitens TaxID=1686743 RepID=UPI0023DAF125|nr:uncharacterized protein LOC128960857 isoform X2 [Oppia nitens]